MTVLERVKAWAFEPGAVDREAESPYTAVVVRADDLTKLIAVVEAADALMIAPLETEQEQDALATLHEALSELDKP